MTSVLKWACILCRFHQMLKPGGRLLISDYCRGPHPPSTGFSAYIAQRGYHLHTVEDYGELLKGAGFSGVTAEDRTWQVSVPPQLINMACTWCFWQPVWL